MKRKKLVEFKVFSWWTGGEGVDPDSLAGAFVVLRQPDGLLIAPEFFGQYFVSQETPTGADQNLYLYLNNV